MPIYEFECGNCQHVFSLIRRIKERDGALVCPDCGSDSIRRKLFAPLVVYRKAVPNPSDAPRTQADARVTGGTFTNLRIEQADTAIKIERPVKLRGGNIFIKDSRIGIDSAHPDVDIDFEDVNIE